MKLESERIAVRNAGAYLEENPLLHIDMLESVRRGQAQILQCAENGVLLRNLPSGAYMMSARDGRTADFLLSRVKHADLFVGHQEFFMEDATEKLGLGKRMVCFQAVYQGTAPLPQPDAGVGIRALDESHLPFVRAHYSTVSDGGYLQSRLKSGTMFGAFAGETLCGFIGMHAEGSMGLLEVLPEYRRRGIALALETFLTNRILGNGAVPFGQVIRGNGASLALQRRLGFTVSGQPVYWLTT